VKDDVGVERSGLGLARHGVGPFDVSRGQTDEVPNRLRSVVFKKAQVNIAVGGMQSCCVSVRSHRSSLPVPHTGVWVLFRQLSEFSATLVAPIPGRK